MRSSKFCIGNLMVNFMGEGSVSGYWYIAKRLSFFLDGVMGLARGGGVNGG
jgi:hypothetical protein